jgi:hypothetical protein
MKKMPIIGCVSIVTFCLAPIADAQTGGRKGMKWDGRNDQGRGVSTGIYFYQLKSEGYIKTRKMVLMR